MSEKVKPIKAKPKGESAAISQRESEALAAAAVNGDKPVKKGPPVAKNNGAAKKGAEMPPQPSKKGAPTPERSKKGPQSAPAAKTPQKGDKKKSKNGAEDAPKKKPRKPAAPGASGMVGYIVDLVCSRTKQKPITRGELYDKLKAKFPERTETAIESWIGYFPGYADQAGHTIETEGRGADRKYWGRKDTHPPWGRRFGKGSKKVESRK